MKQQSFLIKIVVLLFIFYFHNSYGKDKATEPKKPSAPKTEKLYEKKLIELCKKSINSCTAQTKEK